MKILRPETLTQALEFLKCNEGALPIAGFTDIAPALHNKKDSRIINATVGIDLSLLAELKNIDIKEDSVEIGALVTYSDIVKAKTIFPPQFDALVQASVATGTPQVRNRGTIGGNLATASPAADLSVSLCVFDAAVRLKSALGEREVCVTDFYISPRVSCVKSDELITSVYIKSPPSNVRSRFMKVGRRAGSSLSLVNMAIAAATKDGVFETCCVCAGAVAPIPLRLHELESFVAGKTFLEISREEAIQLIRNAIDPISDLHAEAEYRRKTTGKMFYKLLEEIITKEKSQSD
ncbi:MAG: FAD binding domain-containing protein [Synergistaceae bacterium]|nr:FAD binding domain-containing protein [Synergistaceae bacterium]